MENYYQILGISRNATAQEIKQAYQSRLKQNKLSNAEEDGLLSSKQYIDLTAAYNALADQAKKDEYDRILNSILTDAQYRELKKTRVAQTAALPASHLARRRLTKNLMVYGTAACGILLIIAFGIYKNGEFSSFDLFRQNNSVSRHQLATSDLFPKPEDPSTAITSGSSTSHPTAPPKTNNTSHHAATSPSIAAPSTVAPAPNSGVSESNAQPAADGLAASSAPQQNTSPVSTHHQAANANPAAPPTATALNNKDKVLATWGTPKSIIRYGDDDEIWQYASNTVYFHDGEITSRRDSVLLN